MSCRVIPSIAQRPKPTRPRRRRASPSRAGGRTRRRARCRRADSAWRVAELRRRNRPSVGLHAGLDDRYASRPKWRSKIFSAAGAKPCFRGRRSRSRRRRRAPGSCPSARSRTTRTGRPSAHSRRRRRPRPSRQSRLARDRDREGAEDAGRGSVRRVRRPEEPVLDHVQLGGVDVDVLRRRREDRLDRAGVPGLLHARHEVRRDELPPFASSA